MARAADEVTVAGAAAVRVAAPRVAALLHPDTDGDQVMRTMLEVARGMQAELLGLFLEDIELLNLAGMPFAREICFPCATARSLDLARIERGMRAARERLEAAFRASAEDRPHAFRVARGSWSETLIEMVEQADVVVATVASPSRRRDAAGTRRGRALVVLRGSAFSLAALGELARRISQEGLGADYVLVGTEESGADLAAHVSGHAGRVIRVADMPALREFALSVARGSSRLAAPG